MSNNLKSVGTTALARYFGLIFQTFSLEVVSTFKKFVISL